MKAPPALAATAVLAVLLGACSSDYKGARKGDFVASANAVCEASGATVQPELDGLLAGGSRAPTDDALRSFAGDVALPQLQARVDKLRQLEPPAADRADVDDIIRAYQKGIDRISADPTVLADGDAFLEAFSKARIYGLASCAR